MNDWIFGAYRFVCFYWVLPSKARWIQPASEIENLSGYRVYPGGLTLLSCLTCIFLLFLISCSKQPTASTPSQDPATEQEQEAEEELFSDWPDPSIYEGTFKFNPETYEGQPVQLPDLDDVLQSVSWDEWEETNDPVDAVGAITDVLLNRLKNDQNMSQLFSRINSNTSTYTYVFHEPIAREDLSSSARITRDESSAQLSAEWQRHLCWDPGNSEQRSTTIKQEIEFEWTDNGSAQTLKLEISVTIIEFTNGDFQMIVEVNLDRHGARYNSGRLAIDAELNVLGDYTETFERSGGNDWLYRSFDGGAGGTYWCPSRACSKKYLTAVDDILSKTWNELLDGDISLLAFAMLQVLAGLEDSGYEPRTGGKDYCLDVTVDPEYSRLEPDGDEVELTTTVLDWYARPIQNAIVTYENIHLGSISLPVGPTDVSGQRSSVYTSDDPGVEHVRVLAGYSFYTDTLHAEIVIGDELNLVFWAGKDPDQFGGGAMGALAGAISESNDASTFGLENSPGDLPVLSETSYGFFTEGQFLVGQQVFNADGSGNGQTARAQFTTNKQTENGNNVGISFSGETYATAVNHIGTWAEAASEEVDSHVHQPAILVFEIENPEADSVYISFSWQAGGTLGGEPDYSQWWADAFYRVRSCNGEDGSPDSSWQPLFSVDDMFPHPGSGNHEILLTEPVSQIHLILETGALSNAYLPGGDEPPVESWADVSLSLDVNLRSIHHPQMLIARNQRPMQRITTKPVQISDRAARQQLLRSRDDTESEAVTVRIRQK